ncbi:MAG: gliding motility-associated peptidyl-prolyl isomerase GldI [Flavobacteriaceae bacterium]
MNSKSSLTICCILLFVAVGCSAPQPRKPLNKSINAFLQQSAKRNKILLAAEQKQIAEVIATEKKEAYFPSKKGFWYRYKNKDDSGSTFPIKGDLVKFQYAIYTLKGDLLYDAATLGAVRYQVDQEDLLPALREGIKIMKAGEVVVFLFPSYLCYSYQGDGDKIGINQPLRFEISLDTIIKTQTQ